MVTLINDQTKKNIIYASVGAITAETTCIPICTVLTNYQTKILPQPILSYAKDIYKTNGIKGFYNSTWAGSCSQVSSLAIKYTVYERIKAYRDKHGIASDNFVSNLGSSIIGGWCASPFHHPFDVIKTHKQRGENLREIIKEKGVFKTFSNAYSKTLVRNTATSLIFPLYDMYKSLLSGQNSNIILVASPMLTSTTTTLLLYPFMYARNRQIAGEVWWHGFKNINMMYRGLGLGIFRNVSHFTVFCCVLESIKKMKS